MHINSIETALIAVLVVALILYRQTQERAVKDNPFTLPLVLLVLGIAQTSGYLDSHTAVPVGEVVAVLLGFVVAGVLAIPRAHSMTVYRNKAGILVRKGGIPTMLLWVLSIGAHLAISLFVPVLFGRTIAYSGLDGVTLTIYLAISVGVQGLITRGKAARHDILVG